MYIRLKNLIQFQFIEFMTRMDTIIYIWLEEEKLNLINIYHGLSMKELKDMYIALIKHLLLVQFLFMLSMLKKV